MKLVDADALKAVLMETKAESGNIGEVIIKIFCGVIDEQPEAVGRCKDCKWYNGRERTCNDLMGFGRYWKPDDFCSYWKRRTDETD